MTLEKPPKRETGRTKGAKEHSSDKSWERRERESARWLMEHDGRNDDVQYRFLQSSTGRTGGYSALGFDSISKNYIGECKENKKIAGWIIDAWRQLTGLSLTHKKHACLFLWIKNADPWMTVEGKKVRMPNPMHVITKERHADLLAKEKRLEELEVQLLEKENADTA